MIKQLLLVGLGGGLGSAFRYLTSLWILRINASAYPLATFTVNMAGCFLIGLLAGLSVRHELLSEPMKLLLITGFCGGYTTFSAFSAENLFLLENGNYLTMAGYIAASIAGGILAVWAGQGVAKI